MADNDGWIEWEGKPSGFRPTDVVFPDLHPETLVDVKFRDGEVAPIPCTVFDWGPNWANDFSETCNDPDAIIAYRIVKPDA